MTADAATIRLSDYAAPQFQIETVELCFELDKRNTRVTATTVLRRTHPDPGTPLVLAGDGLSLVSVSLDGVALAAERFQATAEHLIIEDVPATGSFTLEVVTQVNPVANTQLKGLYSSSGTYCTQCEAEGFRRITYFLDRPDVMAVYTTRLEADKANAPILLANGNLIESGDLPEDGRHYAVWHDPHKKPSYLFALVGGTLDVLEDQFTTMSGREVALKIYCEPGKADRCHYAMDALKRSMKWDEEEFGCEYDLDVFMIVAVSDFTMGAMENKGLNIFNDKYILADAETATDFDFSNIEGIVAHEYFHNWTGNRITCRDWFQLCLKEGLTVFRDQEFSSDQRSRPVERIANVNRLKASQFPEDAGPLAHPVRPTEYKEIDNFYTATVYQKGSELIRMLQTVVGVDDFNRGMRLYLDRHDGDATTIEKFLACFQETSETDLTQFQQWYHQAGTPTVRLQQHYDAPAGALTLTLTQNTAPTPGQPDKRPMHIPVELGLVGSNGADLTPSAVTGARYANGVLHLTQSKQTVVFEGLGQRPIVSAFRQFSAPVICQADTSDADLEFLIGHDRDAFNRWQSKQTLATRHLSRATRAILQSGPPHNAAQLVSAMGAVLTDRQTEPMFKSQMLALPSVGDLVRDIGRDVDPDAVNAAHRALAKDLVAAFGTEIETQYDELSVPDDFSPDAAQAGTRALRACLLDLLAVRGDAKDLACVETAYATATNMTDRQAALKAAVSRQLPNADDLLDRFYQANKDDAIVLDKWLGLQASVADPATLTRVQALTRHAFFTLKVPNRVYALLGAFMMANPVAFHRVDGAGYQFACDMIRELDPINGQLAARLLTGFRMWKTMEPVRREHARAALSALDSGTRLSRDAGEILEKILR